MDSLVFNQLRFLERIPVPLANPYMDIGPRHEFGVRVRTYLNILFFILRNGGGPFFVAG